MHTFLHIDIDIYPLKKCCEYFYYIWRQDTLVIICVNKHYVWIQAYDTHHKFMKNVLERMSLWIFYLCFPLKWPQSTMIMTWNSSQCICLSLLFLLYESFFFCTNYKLSFPFSWYKYTRVMTYDLFNIYLTIDLLLYLCYYYLDLCKKKIKQIFLSMYIKWTRAITPVIQFNLIEGYLGKIWGWIYFLLYIIWWHILDTRQLFSTILNMFKSIKTYW